MKLMEEKEDVLKKALDAVGLEVVVVSKDYGEKTIVDGKATIRCLCCALKGWKKLEYDEDDYVRFNTLDGKDVNLHFSTSFKFFSAMTHFLSYDEMLDVLSSACSFMACRYDDMYDDGFEKHVREWCNPFKGFRSLDELRVLADLHERALDDVR